MTRTDFRAGVSVVCAGKKCVRACEHEALVRSLCKVGTVQVVRCQKICRGSVVGAVLDGDLEWFERIDSARLCVAMKKVVALGSRRALPAGLRKRRIKSLRGAPPRQAPRSSDRSTEPGDPFNATVIEVAFREGHAFA